MTEQGTSGASASTHSLSVWIKGRCPRGCGETLFVGEGGYVTCSLLGCPEPDAAHELLQTSDMPPQSTRLVPGLAGGFSQTVPAHQPDTSEGGE